MNWSLKQLNVLMVEKQQKLFDLEFHTPRYKASILNINNFKITNHNWNCSVFYLQTVYGKRSSQYWWKVGEWREASRLCPRSSQSAVRMESANLCWPMDSTSRTPSSWRPSLTERSWRFVLYLYLNYYLAVQLVMRAGHLPKSNLHTQYLGSYKKVLFKLLTASDWY